MGLCIRGVRSPRRAAPSGRAIILVIVVIVLIGAAAAATWWLTRPRYIEPAEAAPANALAFAVLDVKQAVERDTTLNKIWRLAKEKGFDETLETGLDSVIKQFGPQFDVQQDLLDWIGGQLALVSFPVGDDEPDWAALIAVRDVGKAKSTLAKVSSAMAKDQETFVRSRYRRVRIAAGRLQSEPVACAMIGRLVVLSSSAAGVRAVIDAVRDGKSLAQVKDYQLAMDSVPEQAFVRAYWAAPRPDLDQSSEAAGLAKRLLGSLLALREQRFRATAMALTLGDHGLRIDATSLRKSDANPLDLPTCTGEVVEHLPDSTVAAAVFGSPDAYWTLCQSLPEQVLSPLMGAEPRKTLDGLKETITQLTGSDLDKGWLSWMNQESAVALIRPRINPVPSVALILGTDQPEKMNAAITAVRLRTLLMPGLLIPAPDVEHSTWLDSLMTVNVPLPMAGAGPVIATAKDAAVVTSDAETISALLPRPGRKSLRESAKYRRARAALPDRPAGFLYIDAARAFEAAEQAGVGSISILPVEHAAKIFKGIESLAIGFAPEPDSQRVILWLGTDWDDLFAELGSAQE